MARRKWLAPLHFYLESGVSGLGALGGWAGVQGEYILCLWGGVVVYTSHVSTLLAARLRTFILVLGLTSSSSYAVLRRQLGFAKPPHQGHDHGLCDDDVPSVSLTASLGSRLTSQRSWSLLPDGPAIWRPSQFRPVLGQFNLVPAIFSRGIFAHWANVPAEHSIA